MKALKFLKHMKQTDTPYNFREWEINKAIEELEEAQLTRREWYQKGYAEAINGKTCATCKHWEDGVETDEQNPRWCYKGVSDGYVMTVTDKDFCCNKFESKEQ